MFRKPALWTVATYEALHERFTFEARGPVHVKGPGGDADLSPHRPYCGCVGRSDLLAHGVEVFQAPIHTLKRWIGVAFLLDNIPVRAADGFAQPEYLVPIDIALANQRCVVGGGKFFDMDGRSAARIFLQEWCGMSAAMQGIPHIELHDDFRFGVAEKGIPGQLAVQFVEFGMVVMITGPHALGSDPVGDLVHQAGGLLPGGFGTRAFLRQARNDQILVADGPVEFDGRGQGILKQGIEAGMRPAALQAVVVEQLLQLLCSPAIVARELNAFISHFTDGSQDAGKVFGAVFAH